MKWMITDSGLGGLSICAGLEQAIKLNMPGTNIELLYVNATPDDRIGYNALKTQAERITLFNRFLYAAYDRYSPDEIAIACNTLSVIYDETEFARESPVEVRGIVQAGVSLCDTNLSQYPENDLIIFATETTTEAGTYPRLINTDAHQIIAQECPELAHSISNDASGEACRELLVGYVDEALKGFNAVPKQAFAFLGCTHYGYQADIFKDLLEARGVKTKILNPNDLLVKQLITDRRDEVVNNQGALNVRFISRYEIPQAEIIAMEHYLKDSAPQTLQALSDQTVVPDLFDKPSA